MKSDKIGFWQFIKMLPHIKHVQMRKVSVWGKIKKQENGKVEGRTLMEWLGLDRTEVWMQENHKASDSVLKEHQGLLINLMMTYLENEFPESFSNFLSNNQNITQAAHNFGALMFSLGYAKATQLEEDKAGSKKLDELWGKE